MAAGEDLNEVGDLKTYLAGKTKQRKKTHNTPHAAASMAVHSATFKKTNDYRKLEEFQ